LFHKKALTQILQIASFIFPSLIKVRTASHQVVLDANGAEAAIGEQEKRALALLTYGVNTSRFRHKFLKVVAY
jgi:hypothetical protein